MKNQPQKKLLHKPHFEKDSLYFVPLGGSEQFGVNMNVYISGGKFLVVDCGMGFADERFPGIDLVLPDPEFLEQNREKIAGLVITHAHEDHIGAVAYLWKRLQCPIYTTRFTGAVLRVKLNDHGVHKVPVNVVKPNEQIDLGPFGLTFIPVSHSVPDTCSLLIETPEGNVLHSGDWNLDPKPVVGQKINEEDFKKAGQKNIIAYVGDSTNAEVPGRAGSESEVEKGLETEFRKCKGRVAVTIFSSNVGRIISIVRAAQKCGRRVAVVGRSLHKMIDAAMECGYLRDVPHFLDEDEVEDVPPSELVMIVTGSQGEFRSALARLARGEHQSFALKRGDTVIFSARSIPGNERAVNDVKNNLSGAGVYIITPSDTDSIIHVSGHPCRDEIAEMYQWVRPQTVIPVHGERVQLEAHAAFARQCQIPNVIVPSNGTIIKLAPGRPVVVDHITTGLLAVDQKRIISIDHGSISDRRKLQFTGAVHLSLVLDAKGMLKGEPKLDTVGLIDQELSGERKLEDSLYNEIMDILEDMADEDLTNNHFVEEELRIGIRRFFVHTLGFKPKTTVHVLRI
ncbi:MAG TPA: ribonuclease J [Alphaproteobacteria bacterium]|nr:ribonuclease J [Micavibrio sp.]MBK9563308.1 ribonuclease J [Micavibrio sp.]HQX27510.1 ribonuclease J [Alphaproteobacteria bacterium]